MKSSDYTQADESLRCALAEIQGHSAQELAQNNLSRLRRKVLDSLQNHWSGLTLFADHPQIPMDNNGAERVIRPGALGRKNYYGSASRWSAQLLAMMFSLLQTLVLHNVNPRTYLSAYLQACAFNGSKAPEQLEAWLPWNFIPPDAAGVGDSPVNCQARAP